MTIIKNDEMVESNATMTDSAAEDKKNLGNAEFKKGNHGKAIAYYTEAIDLQPTEQALSNRAASYIATKEYRKALDDCKAAIRINPDFARVYKRFFKAHLALGNINDAKEALDRAVELDPNDKTNKQDKESMDTVIHQQSMIDKFNSEAD